jgi:ERCC4-related helicase
MPKFVSHPLIMPETLQSRLYQQKILGRAVSENLLVVLPTGLGKTPIAVMLAVHRLERYPEKRILVLAPTKPLTGQHFASFRKFLKVPAERFQVVTGEMKPGERKGLYAEKQLIFATPQTIRNDLQNGKLSLSDFSLLVFDEAHHAIGGYAYPYIAKKYTEQAEEPRILALSASPGASHEKIREICENLGVEAVDVRSEKDTDVMPYVKQKEVLQLKVALPPSFIAIRELITKVYEKKLGHLRKFGFRKPARIVSKKDLLRLQADFMGRLSPANRSAFAAVSIVTQCIKLEHAIGLLETQGIRPLMEYWEKMGKNKTKADKILSNDAKIKKAMHLTRELSERGSRHPKISKLCSVVDAELSKNPGARIIVFANYRTSVGDIVQSVSNVPGARPVRFVGQKEGVTQKHQLETVKKFRDGEYNILVATAVGEEGLDIPSANLAIFYEPVPSPLRSIQRRGRVGRADIGKVVLLITEGTRDEGYYWTAHHKEKRMKTILKGMKESGEDEQSAEDKRKGPLTLDDFC